MAAEIMSTYFELKKIKPNIGGKALMRSMGIFENTTERAVDSVKRYFIYWDIEPKKLPIWLEFYQEYIKINTLPRNAFDGNIIDGRKPKKGSA